MEKENKDYGFYQFPNGAVLLYHKQLDDETTKCLVGFISGGNKDKIPGTAHFVEHMVCKETPEIGEKELDKYYIVNNIINNAMTNENFVMLDYDLPSKCFRDICQISNNLLTNTSFDKKSIDLERMAINQEILLIKDLEANEQDDIIDRIQTNLVQSTDIIGTRKSIAKINEKVLRKYINQNFVTDNLVVSVVSNLDFDEVKKTVEEELFENMKTNPALKNTPEKAQYDYSNNYINAVQDNLSHTVRFRMTHCVKQMESQAQLYSLVQDYVFNGFGGRLLNKLRTDSGAVYTTGYYNGILFNGVSVELLEFTTSKKYLNKSIDMLGEIIDELITKGITQEELDELKEMARNMKARKDDSENLQPEVLLNRYLNGTPIFVDNQLDNIENLTLEEVNKYFKDVYSNSNAMIDIIGNFNPEKLYNVHKIEEKLHCKESKVFYNGETDTYLFPDNYDIVTKDIMTDQRLESLKKDGSLGVLKGAYFVGLIFKRMSESKIKKKVLYKASSPYIMEEERDIKKEQDFNRYDINSYEEKEDL